MQAGKRWNFDPDLACTESLKPTCSTWTDGGAEGKTFWQWNYVLTNTNGSAANCTLGLSSAGLGQSTTVVHQIWNVDDTLVQNAFGEARSASTRSLPH